MPRWRKNLIRALKRPDTAIDCVLANPKESSKEDRDQCFWYVVSKITGTIRRARDWEDLMTPFYLRFQRCLSRRVEPINDEQHLIRLSRQMFENCRIDAERLRAARESRLQSLNDTVEAVPNARSTPTERIVRVVPLMDCINQLPEPQQTIVRLVDLEGRSQREVAIELDLGERHVSRLRKSAHEQLNECMRGRKRSKKQ